MQRLRETRVATNPPFPKVLLRNSLLLGFLIARLLFAADPAPAASPVIEFLGERFVPRLTDMEGSLGIGFDPVNRHVLSVHLKTPCGNALMSNLTSDSGVSWDPVGQEFWFLGNNREVYHYVAGMKEVLFQIPETFDVPGVGTTSLESPQGLALDLDHVYVVDAGPNLGELASNEWLKFTRDGTPVSSSGATDFLVELQPHFDAFGDCIVDGIAWVPPGTPLRQAEGEFLVAIEHSGIQVIDADGFFVTRIVWQDEGFPIGLTPFAFAGITVDPLLGDLYLVENAGMQMHVWERIQDDESHTHLYGFAVPTLHAPVSSCDWPLLFTSVTGLHFSLTYRDVDGLLWTNDYGSGEIFTMDPKYPKPASVGTMGVQDVWGMAYDDERDVLYVFEEGPHRIHVLDPVSLQTTPLPNAGTFVRELAFGSDDKAIYGVGDGTSGTALWRFDRDTGAAQEVGPTASVAGLTYDRSTGKLIGIQYSGGNLYEIDPATGQAQVLAENVNGGWEGLAAVPVGSPATPVEPEVYSTSVALRAFPNPLAGRAQITFDLPRSGLVSAVVLDVRGRRVADLHSGPLPAGPNAITWNGRDGRGRPVAGGVYLLRLSTPWQQANTKITVIR